MATFIDEDENKPQEDEQFATLDAEEPEIEVEAEAQSTEDIPEKYKGKSVKDIIRMHQEAEKAMGKQGSEVGELRRIVDDFITAQTVTKQQAPVEEEVDFFSDPDTAIAKAIERHPKVKQAEEMSAQMKKSAALNELKAAHPDYLNILQDGGFAEWIGKSKVRQELFVRADQQFDFDAANELLSTWKERQQVVQQTANVEAGARKNAVKAASTGGGRGSGETSSKKIYRRQDIIDLMQRDPDRYQALAPEIMQAYAEKRVR